MSTVKMSSFPPAVSVTDSTIIPVLDGGANKKVTGTQLKTYIGTISGPTGPTGATGPTGPTGYSGIVEGATAPADTSILWLNPNTPATAGIGATGASGMPGSILGATTVTPNPLTSVTVPTAGINITNEIITISNHPFNTGDPVVYSANGGTTIGGLADGNVYWVHRIDANAFYLYDNLNNSLAGGTGGRRNLTSTGNNAQTFTYAYKTVDYDITGNNRIFIQPTSLVDVVAVRANLVASLNSGEGAACRFIIEGQVGADIDFILTTVNGNPVTGVTLTNAIKRNRVVTTILVTVVNIGGTYTIYS